VKDSPQTDLFLSYSKTDVKLARIFADEIANYGLSVWFDEWFLVPGEGENVKNEVRPQNLDAASIVVLVGSSGLSQLQKHELNAVARDKAERIVFVLLPGGTRSKIPYRFRDQAAIINMSHGLNDQTPWRLLETEVIRAQGRDVTEGFIKEWAKRLAGDRDVAEGFIEEMAKRVASDKALDLEGKQQAVRNAIEIYEKEIAGRPVETNLGDIVGLALARARQQVDRGQSGLARATLRKAAEEMQREEEERRERYAAGVTALYTQVRDIALATYDGEAAAATIMAQAQAVHGPNATKIAEFLSSEAAALERYGDERGSNVHLVAAIALRQKLLETAGSDDERGGAHNNLGIALFKLGEREAETARLKDAISAYRAALEERTHERVPLDWAMTQNNLGNALETLGARETGTSSLEEAVAAYRAALEERTRERVPLDWATTQNDLGVALMRLGERESGAARLVEAATAFRAALKETMREQAPLQWATMQMNVGSVLLGLGARESETERLGESVAAYRAALQELTRERAPLVWAATQTGIGVALTKIGERESGTARLEEAVEAYRAALEEGTRERVPLDWAATQMGLGIALMRLGERESGTKKLDEAVQVYGAALQERTRERVPLDWADTSGNQGIALMIIADRNNDAATAETAVSQIEAARETLRAGGHMPGAAFFQAQLRKAQAIRDRLKGK
jgi:tetratricopeptide (TPR) repeat protein